MRQVRWWLGALAGVMAVAGAARATASADEPARVIVKLRAPVVQLAEPAGPTWASAQSAASSERGARQRMWALGQRAGVSLSESRELGGRTHLARAQGMSSAALARRLAAQSDVEYAVVDERRKPSAAPLASVPNDPLYATDQWYLQDPQATGGQASSINAPAAWAITHGNPSVVVAVLDTGVRYDHPDLQGKLLPGYNMISSPVVANNGVGRSDNASDLGDWLTQAEKDAHPEVFTSKCPVQSSSSWHGTRVAGLIGASTNDGLGMAGLGWDTKILPVRVLGKCGGYDSDIVAGMRWAAGVAVPGVPANPNPARVVNLSLGRAGTCSQAYTDAVAELAALKVVVVVAAGNTDGEAVDAPANCPGVIAVGALRHAGTKVGYSALGPEVSISAPGGNCVNTSGACQFPMVTTTSPDLTEPTAAAGTYTTAADPSLGTSFSAPLVAGVAALMIAVNPDLPSSQVRQILMDTARAFPRGGAPTCVEPSSTSQAECVCTTATCGAGMLDASAAVAVASGATPNPASPSSTTPAPVTQSGGGGGGGAMTLVDLAVLGGAAVLAALSGRVGQTRQNGRRRQGRPK